MTATEQQAFALRFSADDWFYLSSIGDFVHTLYGPQDTAEGMAYWLLKARPPKPPPPIPLSFPEKIAKWFSIIVLPVISAGFILAGLSISFRACGFFSAGLLLVYAMTKVFPEMRK